MDYLVNIFTYELPILECSLLHLILVFIWVFGCFYLWNKAVNYYDNRQKQ